MKGSPTLNCRELERILDNFSSSSTNVSSEKSGESSFAKRKKEKGEDQNRERCVDAMASSLINKRISSVGGQSIWLAGMDSEVSTDKWKRYNLKN